MPNFPTPISAKAAILQKRHITNEQAEILKVGPISVRDAEDHLGYTLNGAIASVEALPYFDAEGHELGEPQFFRFRINYTPGWEPPDGDWKLYPKYRSPRRKGEFPYLPRGVGMDWVAIFGEPQVPMIFTEGEYKAIRVCSAWDKPCIGLGGVWMFHASKPGWPVGMDMNLLERECYIIYDADKESTVDYPLKKGVNDAARRLAYKLSQSKAVPWLLYIARTKTFNDARVKDINAKMGIDDYIDAGGTWEELLATRENPVEHAQLAYLFSNYAVYTGPSPGVARLSDGHCYKTSDFHTTVEANCIGNVMIEKGGKLVPQEIKFTQLFIKHPDQPTFSKYIFEPSLPHGLDQERGTYNKWNGMAVEGYVAPGEAERYKEVVGIWKKFVTRLCGGTEYADYFEQWVADLFQNPGRKTTIAMLLRSSLNGVGKSLLGEILRDIVGEDHSVRMELDNATHHFNAPMAYRVLLQVDEANDFQKKHDSKLKQMVTEEECLITLKGRDSIVVKNYARIFITSNSVAPIMLDEHNRRFYVMTPDLTVEDEKGEWGKWVGNVPAKVLRSEEGLRMLRWYFDTIDIKDWVPTANVPQTDAMRDVVEASSSKSNELVDYMWRDFLNDSDGIWMIGGRLAAMPESKLIKAKFKEGIKTTGGQAASIVMKIPGETGSKRVWVFVRSDVDKLETRHVKDQGLELVPGAISSEALLKAKAAMDKSFTEWAGIIPSNKY